MKCPRGPEDEYTSLIQCPVVSPVTRCSHHLPLYFLLCASVGTSLTLGSYCWVDKPASCLPEVWRIPFLRPYIFQVCMFVACGLGMTTLFAFYEAVAGRIPNTVNAKMWEWTALITGQLSMVVLLLFTLAPSETSDFSKAWLMAEEHLLASLYFLLVCLHSISSHYLHSLLHSQEVVSQGSPWRDIRYWTLVVIICTTLGHFMLIGERSDYGSLLRRICDHILLHGSYLSLATYQETLSAIEVRLSYQAQDVAFKQINRVTL